MNKIFAMGSSVEVDPKTRKVTAIDGKPVAPEDHTADMQAFADAALKDFFETPASAPQAKPRKAAPDLHDIHGV